MNLKKKIKKKKTRNPKKGRLKRNPNNESEK